MHSQADFEKAIHSMGLALVPEQIIQASRFAEILYRENQSQNLTRIEGVEEFIEGHLIDVVELLGVPTLGLRIMDLGSGSGVPGLLSGAICANQQRSWHLVESESHKAAYLDNSSKELGLKNTFVYGERGESAILDIKPDTVIARAVGTVDKIAGWIWNCSTWNNLILFKSKGWEREWGEAQKTRFGKKLTITHTHDYSTNHRTRLLVTLKRKSL